MTVGFLGLGRMGEPMATRLVEHGTDLVVWNRSPAPVARLVSRGATQVSTPAEVLERCDTVVLMLANDCVTDEVLAWDGTTFGVPVVGRTVVNMGTIAPERSADLARRLAGAGASYCEAPVSGSRVPAEHGQLVAMLAGDTTTLDRVEPLLEPLTSAVFRCGPVPRALETKLAVNVFLIATVAALAESVAFAERCGVELDLLRRVLDAGPMASAVSRGKLAKLVDGDLSAQAAVSDVLYNNRLIVEAARAHDAAVPLLSVCESLLVRAESLGLGGADMVAMVEAVRSPGPDADTAQAS
jgi:3-hydroxyisobutyrate dehydrogenase